MKASRCASAGFTLIELIMVIVLLGVLSVFVAPRFVGPSLFDARGFHDQTLAYLRYAQKAAIAQRRTVCVAFTSQSLTLTVAASAGVGTCAAAGTLVGPRGETPVVLRASTGVAYSSTPVGFHFDGLGQPLTTAGAVITSQGSLPSFSVQDLPGTSITVEALTGYVHD